MKRGETFNDDSLHAWPIVAVSSGVVSLQHLLENGRKTIAALFMCGDIIDLRSASHKNRGNLISLKPSEVCRLSPTVFERIVTNNPNAHKIVWSNLREQVNRSINHSVDLAKKQAMEKLASFIFECKHQQSSLITKNKSVTIPVRRIDLAEYIGMQPSLLSMGYLCKHTTRNSTDLLLLFDLDYQPISNTGKIVLRAACLYRTTFGQTRLYTLNRHTSARCNMLIMRCNFGCRG